MLCLQATATEAEKKIIAAREARKEFEVCCGLSNPIASWLLHGYSRMHGVLGYSAPPQNVQGVQ